MIHFSDISVVVQGPVFEDSSVVLSGIRRVLPGATVILSTWEGSDLSGLDYDVLVENKDPGAHEYTWRRSNNLKRQLVSTLAGLREVRTRYVLKLRSDLVLESTDFLSYFESFPHRHSSFTIFEKRILNAPARYVAENMIHSAVDADRFLFHINDFIFFGLTSDLLKLWDIPQPSDDFFSYFDFGIGSQFCPEQYIWLMCLRKYGDVQYKDALDFSFDALSVSDMSMTNNFIFLDVSIWKFYSIKYPFYSLMNRVLAFPTRYSFYLWQRAYRYYCAPEFNVTVTRE